MIGNVSSRVLTRPRHVRSSRARVSSLGDEQLRELSGYRGLAAPLQSSLCQSGTVGLRPFVGRCVNEWLLRVVLSYSSVRVYVVFVMEQRMKLLHVFCELMD
jgi:hypothetical protein